MKRVNTARTFVAQDFLVCFAAGKNRIDGVARFVVTKHHRWLMASRDTSEKVLGDENVVEAVKRGFIEVKNGEVIYNLASKKTYKWSDPEEWVRARLVAFLLIVKGYPANRLKTEVSVPRRTPNDFADIVVYKDDRCREPYLVVEVKSFSQSAKARRQSIEQAFGNANSLRAPLTLYDEWSESILFDVAGYPAAEREENRRGSRDVVPAQYGEFPFFRFTAGGEEDISPARANEIIAKIRRAHSIIWSGGKRDPLTSFDEWSKLLFAKVIDERTTPTGHRANFRSQRMRRRPLWRIAFIHYPAREGGSKT
jgi:type I restriction enzyme M protein